MLRRASTATQTQRFDGLEYPKLTSSNFPGQDLPSLVNASPSAVTLPPESRPFAWLGLVTGVSVVVLGLLVLMGWANDVDVLKRIHPGLTAMNPLTAVILILSGIAILLAQGGLKRCARAISSVILAVALAKMANIFWGGIRVDHLLFANRIDQEMGVPNAMAPNTAFAFFLIALNLIFASSQSRRFHLISQALGGRCQTNVAGPPQRC